MKKRVLTQEELEIVIKMNNEFYSFKKIGEKINCHQNTVRRIMKELNIEKTKSKKINHYLKEDFFNEITTEEQAYIVGLLKTDGYVKNNKNGNALACWGICLKESDRELLEKIQKIVGSDNKLTYDKRDKKHSYQFAVYSRKMCEDLRKYEIIPNKTYSLEDIQINLIPEHLRRHYLRGLLDGDGSIYIDKSSNSVVVSFTGYNELFVKSFQNEIDKAISKNSTNSIFKANAYFCRWKGNIICLKILEYLYSDATIFLDRKNLFYKNLKSKSK